MNKTVGTFTKEKLEELASQPNVTVMQPTHDIVFDPWTCERVVNVVDLLIQKTQKNKDSEKEEIQKICKLDDQINEFSQKYQTFFAKLTDPLFVSDKDNIKIIKQMIILKSASDKGMISEENAKAQAADIALKMLAQKVKNK